MAGLLLILSLLLMIMGLFKKTRDDRFFQVGGALIIAMLAMMANQAFAYIVVIFIIGSFVTPLEFLENIAAIFWGRKEVWDYRKAIRRATPIERETKLAAEAEAPADTLSLQPRFPKSEVVRRLLAKEENVLNKARQLLAQLGTVRFMPNVALHLQSGMNIVLDAIADMPRQIFVIEVKTIAVPSLEHMGIGNLRAALVAINAINALSNVPRPARGLLVVLAASNLPDIMDDEIAVLKYDEQLNFTNAKTVLDWMRAGER